MYIHSLLIPSHIQKHHRKNRKYRNCYANYNILLLENNKTWERWREQNLAQATWNYNPKAEQLCLCEQDCLGGTTRVESLKNCVLSLAFQKVSTNLTEMGMGKYLDFENDFFKKNQLQSSQLSKKINKHDYLCTISVFQWLHHYQLPAQAEMRRSTEWNQAASYLH